MQLPKRISPNPLLTSTIEIRFESVLTPDAVLKTFYPVFGEKYPNMKEANNIPKELKANPVLEYTADFVLSNDHYSISVGKNVIAFENIGTYHLWPDYFKVICENLKLLERINIVKSIKRVGVRYASFFEGKMSASKILKHKIGFNYEGYEEHLQVYQTFFKRNNTSLFLQVAPNAIVQKQTAVPQGFLIDIDASAEGNGNLNIGDQLFSLIEKLHKEEKELFFSLLNDDFLKSLNPEY